MNGRLLALLPAAALVAAACATADADVFQDSPAPPAVAEPSAPPIQSSDCTCSEDGRTQVCDGGASTPCQDGHRCFGGQCIEDACETAKGKQSAEGCSFYTVVPDVYDGRQGCYAVFLTNTSPRPVDVTLRTEGKTIHGKDFVYIPAGSGSNIQYEPLPDGQIPPDGLAIAFITGPTSQVGQDAYATCPAKPAFVHDKGSPREAGYVSAIALETTEPVVASDIYPYGGADSYVTGASILLPKNAWGSNYVSVVPQGGAGNGAPYLDLVATEDTVVTLSPKSAGLLGGDIILATAVGDSTTVQVPAGQVYHLVDTVDLTGVVLSADKPFLAIAGSRCWGLPCDGAHQQLPSVATLGSEYALVGHRDRIELPDDAGTCNDATEDCSCRPITRETHRYRIVGLIDGTVLAYEPAFPPGAPRLLSAGQDVWISSETPFTIRSQDQEHPFLVAELMSSCQTIDPCGKYGCPGDPELTTAVPTTQFLDDYLFFTDPTYPTTHLVLVRRKDDQGNFGDVELDCMGNIEGWAPLGKKHEYARVDLVKDGVGQHGCENGRHHMKSTAPFSVVVWGWGSEETGATSYAFPASRGVRPVSPVVVK